MPILQAQAVRKQYKFGRVTVDALADVDFAVNKGEFVAIMGPSGSGKSTLLNVLGGLDNPSNGEVTLADKKLSLLNDHQITLVRRRHVGFIFQFYNLVPTLTAEENIALPLLIAGKKVADNRARIDQLLDLVGIADRRRHKPDELSGGEQQRVAIARAFITEPSIVLADEPTGNLDSKNGEDVLKLLRASCDKMGQTIIMVTHDAKAASYADRVVFLKDGRIVDQHNLNGGRGETAKILEHLKALE
jgi:putative ABC transport system ATP-binding protein